MVLLGEIKRVDDVAGKLVPFMAVACIVFGLIILFVHRADIPAAFALIISSAFTSAPTAGGFAGATVWAAFYSGISRAIFSSEAGMGSSSIVHASARTNGSAQQGAIAMPTVFIDTLLICFTTAPVVVITGAWQSGKIGASMPVFAFESVLPNLG